MAGGGKGSIIAAMTDQVEFFTPPSQDQRTAAARLICANATGDTHEEQVADARDLCAMLGLLPGQEDEDFILPPTGTTRSRDVVPSMPPRVLQ